MSGATQLAVGAALAAVAIGLLLAGRALFRDQARRSTLAALHRFRARLDRYKLVRRPHIKRALLADADIAAAVRAHAAAHGEPEAVVWRRVAGYLDEIVPAFNVLSYYRLGYNLSRALIHLLYRPTIAYEDVAALERIPRRDVVVYLMNHRSNADYVVVAFVLAQVVSISYAVGEWARTWPLEFLFKSFGSYFVRRGYREPLYHTVLARYVQLITRNGVTQGIFPEGGLTRDGALRPPKLGLLDSIVGTLREFNARIVRNELTITEVWDRAWRMLALRHLVLQQGEEYVILPHQRPLLEYYANSIRHLLPEDHRWALTPALESDPTLPRLSRRDELS